MENLKYEDGKWVPAEPIPYKGLCYLNAGWPAKGTKRIGRYWIWIGKYQIGWNIP